MLLCTNNHRAPVFSADEVLLLAHAILDSHGPINLRAKLLLICTISIIHQVLFTLRKIVMAFRVASKAIVRIKCHFSGLTSAAAQ